MPKIQPKVITKASEAPDKLKAYVALGVEISWKEGQSQAVGTCPFCTNEKKLYINVETGQGDCKVCQVKFNVSSFMKEVHEQSMKSTKESDYKDFANSKGLLNYDMLTTWGLCKSFINDMWILPGYGVPDGEVKQLYRYIPDNEGHYRFLPCPGFPSGQGQHLYGYGSFDPNKPEVYICEGFGDGAILKETLAYTKRIMGGTKTVYSVTPDEEESMLNMANVVAVPGANTFLPSWTQTFEGKRVYLCYDNDHHKNHPTTGQYIEPAGYAGMKNAAKVVSITQVKVDELNYLKWSKDEKDIGYDSTLPDGYDVKDVITQGVSSLLGRTTKLGMLISMMESVPQEWLTIGGEEEEVKKDELKCIPCSDWEELRTAWKKAMEWTDGLDIGLSVILSAVASTPAPGDQLWIRLMSPASTGKSWFAQAIATARNYVVAKSSIRGFFSGAKSEDDRDLSLIAELKNKTFIMKDGDTLLTSPNKDQILAEARDLFDGTGNSSYRSGRGRDYSDIRMTWILCGTGALHSLDTSELGERFLSCVIMRKIDEKVEKAINIRAGWRALRNASQVVNGEAGSKEDPDKTYAKQLTGGYVEYLRVNAQTLVEKVTDKVSDELMEYVSDLAVFVAHMRARPSRGQDDTTERELAARLTAQLSKLMVFMTVVMGKTEVDQEVLNRVRKVAIDTSEGKTLTYCQRLIKSVEKGFDTGSLAKATPYTNEQVKRYMRFLKSIDVVESITLNGSMSLRYRMTPRMVRLYRLVIEGK